MATSLREPYILVNEAAARVVVKFVGSEHKRWNDDVFWGGRRRRRRWWRRVGNVERRRRRRRPSLTDSKEEISQSFPFMVGYGGHDGWDDAISPLVVEMAAKRRHEDVIF